MEGRCSKIEKEVLMIWQKQKAEELRNNAGLKTTKSRFPIKQIIAAGFALIFLFFLYSVHVRISRLELR